MDSHRVFDNISCVRRKVRSADIQVDPVTNYTRPTRFILRALDCQKLYRFIAWLSVIYIVYNCQQKVQFSRISCVVSAIVSNIASVKLQIKYYKYIHIV